MELALDNDYDISLVDDAASWLDGVEAIAQHLRVRLQFFKGEWFLDSEIGIPYYQRILGRKDVTIAAIGAILKKAILTTPGVISLNDFRADYQGATRLLSVSFRAQTTEGPLTFTEEMRLGF